MKLITAWMLGAALIMLTALPSTVMASTCSVTVNPVNFGIYNPSSASPNDVSSNMTLTCGGLLGLLINYNILLSTGNSGTYTSRSMLSGVNVLSYNLYTDSGYTSIWGDGTGGTFTQSGAITIQLIGSVTQNYTVFGRIPAQQNAVPGSYSDTITVTVNY